MTVFVETKSMAGKHVNPPKLKDGDDYGEFDQEIEICQIVTDVPVVKQEALIFIITRTSKGMLEE